jgi:hypothetical protein
MNAEVAKYKKLYPNLDNLMIETILNMTDEQHQKFQQGIESGETADAPKKLILEDAIKIINSSEAVSQTDV